MLGEIVSARVLSGPKRVIGIVTEDKPRRIKVLEENTGITHLCKKESAYPIKKSNNKEVKESELSAENKNIKDLMILHNESIGDLSTSSSINPEIIRQAIYENRKLSETSYKRIIKHYKVKRGFFNKYGRAVHGTDYFRFIVGYRMTSVRYQSGYEVTDLMERTSDPKVKGVSHIKRIERGEAELPPKFQEEIERIFRVPEGSLTRLSTTHKERELAKKLK